MRRYDPERPPDPRQWLELDEQERILLVEEHHRRVREKLPNVKLHAVIHAVVENQIAEGLESVVRAMLRLTTAGLSRHEALHAIGGVLAEQMHAMINAQNDADEQSIRRVYDAALERLDIDSWRSRSRK